MFVETVGGTIFNQENIEVPVISIGILLEVNGKVQVIDLDEVSNIYTDTEELFDAQNFYLTYKGTEYEFQIPDKGTSDWQYLEDIIDTE